MSQPSDSNNDNWLEHRMYVTNTLEELKEGFKEHEKAIVQINVKMAGYGFLGGGAGAAVIAGIFKLFEHVK